jgi:RES domain
MLEKMVHANLVMPANQHFITITIPNGIAYEMFQTAARPDWDSRSETICKEFARDWYDQRRSAILIVPSIPAWPERNFLINPTHPDSAAIIHTLPEPVWVGRGAVSPACRAVPVRLDAAALLSIWFCRLDQCKTCFSSARPPDAEPAHTLALIFSSTSFRRPLSLHASGRCRKEGRNCTAR